MKSLLFAFLFLISCNSSKAQENIDILPKEKILELKNYIKNKDYNQNLAVFINFKIH